MVQIIRKVPLPNASDLPDRLHDAALAARYLPLREPKPLGFPLLFSSEMLLIEPAVQYLHEHGVQRAHSPETVRTYSEIIYDWHETLEQNSIMWNEADAVDLVAYRNRMMQELSGHTKRSYLRSTINHRVRGVLRYYRWAVQMGWLAESPLCGNHRAFGSGQYGSQGKPGNAESHEHSFFILRQFGQLPSPFSPPELREIFAILAPPYHLIARWQLYTGLRIGEVLKVRKEQVEGIDASRLATIRVVRKGGKKSDVILPASLITETQTFISTYREAWRCRARRAGRLDNKDEALFLNSRGAPVGRSAYQRSIRVAGNAIGRHATSHVFRATFACMMLAKLQGLASAGAAINPLLVVKVMMGHEHIETTDRYLRAIAIDRDAIKTALDTLLEDEL